MGENTFRYSPGAPGVQVTGGARGDRAKGAAAGQGTLGQGALGKGAPGHGTEGAGDQAAVATGAGAWAAQASQAAQASPAAPAATYWRRRFIALAVGLAVLAVASWGLSEALAVHLGGKPSVGTFRPSGNGPAPRGGGFAAGSAGQRGVTGQDQGGQGSGESHGKVAPGTVTSNSPAPRPSAATSGFAGFKPAFCSWHSIVLSLSVAQVRFGSGQQPAFSLSVVSTQPADCSFNVGSGHLAVVIKEGPARIWSSADCVNGTGSLVTALRRGVPTVVAIGWNKRTSSPGCNGPERVVPAGSYTAYAAEGSIVSAPVTFRLS